MLSPLLIKKHLLKYYINSRGWYTDRKIIVIESDDWGSIRMPSKDVYDSFLINGYPVNHSPYLKYDSLENNDDLQQLFEVLLSVKDFRGNNPVITANTIVTNPDFEKIEKSGFENYYYELFTETLKKYPNHDKVLSLYKTGIEKNIFYPQLHGREHLNTARWLKSIREGNKTVKLAFENQFYDLSTSHTEISNESFVDAFSINDKAEYEIQNNSIIEAAQIFKQIFKYQSKSFIAPCYIWHPANEETLLKVGVKHIQSGVLQKVPVMGVMNKFTKNLHFTGQLNKTGQLYTVRNCFFEPSFNLSNPDSVSKCLNQIAIAFKNEKPAIICSHRLNYIGGIDIINRNNNLKLLNKLLISIKERWPEVEFINSSELGETIRKELFEN